MSLIRNMPLNKESVSPLRVHLFSISCSVSAQGLPSHIITMMAVGRLMERPGVTLTNPTDNIP